MRQSASLIESILKLRPFPWHFPERFQQLPLQLRHGLSEGGVVVGVLGDGQAEAGDDVAEIAETMGFYSHIFEKSIFPYNIRKTCTSFLSLSTI